MKKAVKPTLYLNGKLLCPLAVGRAAIFSVGDQILSHLGSRPHPCGQL